MGSALSLVVEATFEKAEVPFLLYCNGVTVMKLKQKLPLSFGALLFVMLATAAAWLWSWQFARGPLEAVMRRIAG